MPVSLFEKAKDFGGNIQALFYPGGLPMWVSDVLPGLVHDLATAREKVLAVLQKYTGEMPGLADCGYEGRSRRPHPSEEADGRQRAGH